MSYLYNYSCLFPPPYPVLRQYIIKYEAVRKLSYILKADADVEKGKRGQFNHLATVALNKGQCYFYHIKRWGDRNPQRDIPTPRWYTASGPSWGRAAKQLQSDSNSSAWLAEVHREYAVMISVNLFVFVFFNHHNHLFVYFSNAERILMLRWQKTLSVSTQPCCTEDGCHGDTVLALQFSDTAAIFT